MKVGASGLSITQNPASTATVDFTNDRSPTSSVDFSVELSSGAWHQMSLGVYRRHVTLHVDCDVTVTSPWQRHVASGNADEDDDAAVESSVVLSIGKAFIESSRYPRFEVSLPAGRTDRLIGMSE